MRYWVALLPFVLSACALQPPKPSMWQLANECGTTHPLGEVQSCTRYGLDANYGTAWHAAPQAYAFLDFIGATANRVDRGSITEADGRLAVSNYAAQQSAAYQAAQQAEQAQQNANLQAGLALLQQSRQPPVVQPMLPMSTSMGQPTGNLSCGLRPLAPLGCTVGSCVCDGQGHNCRYQMVCN